MAGISPAHLPQEAKIGTAVRGKALGQAGLSKSPANLVGERLRDLRLDADLTQFEMSQLLGYKSKAASGRVSSYELGFHLPSLHILIRYADAFNMTVSELLNGVL